METAARADCWALVLAGGDGTRLQALTAQITGRPIPKQYCRLLGDCSLLEATLERCRHLTCEQQTLVIVNKDHLVLGQEQLQSLPAENVIVQPCNRETGPGLVFALLRLASRQRDATIAVFPSDHYVADDAAFIAHVKRAKTIVEAHPEKIALLGIRPDRPESGYGYITPAGDFPSPRAPGALRVAGFQEKPTAEQAAALVAQGGLWNSFVMVFRLARLLDLLHQLAPDEVRLLSGLRRADRANQVYRTLSPWNFSRQVLSRIPQHLLVLPVADVHWNDWGTPESIVHSLRALRKEAPWARDSAA